MLDITQLFQKSKPAPLSPSNWIDDLKAQSSAEEMEGWNMFQEGQLLVDMYERPDAIIVRSLIAGVDPDNLEISLHNDLLTIRGARGDFEEVCDDQFYHRECYWGGFRRTIVIPVPVVADDIRAFFKNGVVTIELPKLIENSSIRIEQDEDYLEE